MTKRTDPPPAWLAERLAKNWHRNALRFWCEIDGAPATGSVQQRAEYLVENKNKLKRHVLRALALDLMCASYPEDNPPPDVLVQLMSLALGLPRHHHVGSYLLHDGRGRYPADLEAREIAMVIDAEYFFDHDERMPLRQLQSAVKQKLGHEPHRTSSLKKWREQEDYCRFCGWSPGRKKAFKAPGAK